jgi:glycogen debranching enzyme
MVRGMMRYSGNTNRRPGNAWDESIATEIWMATAFRNTKHGPLRGTKTWGWKDAEDSVVYPDGSRVKGPKALCELQAYTYDAWLRRAEAFQYFGDAEYTAVVRQKARALHLANGSTG